MTDLLFDIAERLEWNDGRSLPFESLLQKYPSLRRNYEGAIRSLQTISESIWDNNCIWPLEKNWTNLIVLDACRYDVFKEHNNIDGNLKKVISPASQTSEWIKKNITGKYSETVLIAANPKLSKIMLRQELGFIPFSHIEPVWDNGWNDDLKTVPPTAVIKSFKEIREKYPRKNIIAWFLQPHHPFIGKIKTLKSYIRSPQKIKGKSSGERERSLKELLERGEMPVEKAYRAYIENLKLVLEKIDNLLVPYLNKTTIITADHGNCFGELGLFAHPPGIYIPPLVEVPWFKVNIQSE